MLNPIARFFPIACSAHMDDQSEKVQQAIDLLSSITNSASLAPGRSRVGGADGEEPGPSRFQRGGGMPLQDYV